MRITLTTLVCASVLALSAICAHAQTPGPGASPVGRLAELIESKYFDPAKAASLARSLRDAMARGEFDGLRDPRDLAAALSTRLQREDGHLAVVWVAPAGVRESSKVDGPPRMPDEVRDSRSNFGFRRVEIVAGNIGLIELTEFADFDPASAWDSPARRTADAALAFVERSDALIVDLRDNGGGGGMGTYLLSHFLPSGIAFSEMRGRTSTRVSRTLKRVGGRRRLDVPVYVLVSGRTGSAAEFFAYSLQALQRATIVGERTAGAANPGMTFDLGEGFEAFIPLDTPVNRRTGTNWEGVGVQPDVTVDAAGALVRAQIMALEGVLRSQPTPAEAQDVRWTLDALRPPDETGPADLTEFAGTYGNRVLRIESGTLVLRRARWPPRILRPLGPNAFFVEGAPWRRVSFDRDADGRIVALVESTSTGDVTRWQKTVR